MLHLALDPEAVQAVAYHLVLLSDDRDPGHELGELCVRIADALMLDCDLEPAQANRLALDFGHAVVAEIRRAAAAVRARH